MNTTSLPPLVVIAGPTASGKSALAMAVADLIPSVIVNADAMQVYADLRVVTARPSPSDEARHLHALFGYLDGATAGSAASWAAAAKATVADAHGEGRLPILVGGSGLYIRTLLDGIAPVPAIDPDIRRKVRMLAVAQAHAALMHEDHVTAQRLAPADTARVARALEVVRSTGRPLGHWQRQLCGGIGGDVRLVPVVLTPDREQLGARIDARFDTMLRDGRDEVAALTARALDPRLPVMRAIGVREIAAVLDGSLDAQTAGDAASRASRQYAKRQTTWFANQLALPWMRLNCFIDAANMQVTATMLARGALTP